MKLSPPQKYIMSHINSNWKIISLLSYGTISRYDYPFQNLLPTLKALERKGLIEFRPYEKWDGMYEIRTAKGAADGD